MKVGKSIFEIGSMNKFWSTLYAKLYKDLIHIFPIMKQISEKSFESFLTVFEVIRYVDAEKDYDEEDGINYGEYYTYDENGNLLSYELDHDGDEIIDYFLI